jgi:mannose-6-phosphate isomerase-like protein (cupin superfamily)
MNAAVDLGTASPVASKVHLSPLTPLAMIERTAAASRTVRPSSTESGGSRGASYESAPADSPSLYRPAGSRRRTASRFSRSAMFFDGRIWHGSENLRRVGTRYALLLQYATPRTAIRIPGPQRFEWPFELDRAPRAPCILISGRDDGGVNRIVSPPVGGGQDATALSSRVHGLDLPLECDVETGWKPHGLFRGSTVDIADLRCHVSVLEPGRSPHTPHRHEAEELLVIIEGEVELLLEDGADASGIRRHVVGPGTFAYYPGGFAHTIENTSAAPVTYCMLKWKGDARNVETPLGARVVALDQPADPTIGERAITDVLDGQTTYLRQLHAHTTTLPPGVGYEPHRDSYDVGIVTLAGRLETLGEQVDAPGVVFYAAGEPHGMRNVGDEPAHYLVFELHGRHSTSGPNRRPHRR